MKRIASSIFNSLRASNATLCMCWRVELTDGTVFGFTEHDTTLTIDGVEYEPTNGFSTSAIASKADFSVANLNVTALTSGRFTEDDLLAGKFDDAKVRIFYVDWTKPTQGSLPLVAARLGEVTLLDGQFETELRSVAQALQQPIGDIYTLECRANLGDGECGVDLEPWTFTGVVTGLNDSVSFIDSTRTEEDGFFQYGEVTFTSGLNEGLTTEVRGYIADKHMISLLEPPGYAVQKGDEYQIIAGCDKTCDTCRVKFNNLDNFRGFPHMPTEQEATASANVRQQE